VKRPVGTAVEGLTAKDFVVTEDASRRRSRFVDYQRLDSPERLPACRCASVTTDSRRAARPWLAGDRWYHRPPTVTNDSETDA
jgi:hypothetical protein